MRDLSVRYKYTGGAVSGYYFEFNNDTNFLPLKKQKDKADKTLHDFVNSFFQQLNVIKDEIIVNDEQVMKLSRFDDIETKAEVIDFGDIKDNFKFIPKIEGYAQENYIRFKEIYPEGNKDLNSKILTSLNKNIDATTELFTIDAYVNSFLNIGGGVVPDLSPKEAFKTFSFFIDGGLTDDFINIYNSEGGNEKSAAFRLQKAALYNLSGEYNFLDKIITYPKFYIVEKWLTLNDVKKYRVFQTVFY